MADVWDGVWVHAGALAGVNGALWVASLAVGKAWPVDFIWSSWPIAHAAWLATSGGTEWPLPRPALVVGVTALWGLRLTWNFIARGGIGHEDWRYTDMRRQFGAHYWWISLFSVFLGQSIFMWAGCLSLYPAIRGNDGTVTAGACAGAAVSVAAAAIEAVSDRQLDAFIRDRAAGRSTGGGVMSSGLWGWSRHPNYFGEWLFWAGLWAQAGGEVRSPATAGPAVMTALFLGVSIGLMERRQVERKGDAYRAYQREVPSPLVPLPPAVARLFRPRAKAG